MFFPDSHILRLNVLEAVDIGDLFWFHRGVFRAEGFVRTKNISQTSLPPVFAEPKYWITPKLLKQMENARIVQKPIYINILYIYISQNIYHIDSFVLSQYNNHLFCTTLDKTWHIQSSVFSFFGPAWSGHLITVLLHCKRGRVGGHASR
jgi:hypothetical protein